jgi:hypothetical protein
MAMRMTMTSLPVRGGEASRPSKPTTSVLGLELSEREPQARLAPGSTVAVVDGHGTAVRFSDLAAEKQPDSGALGFGAEERHE